MRKTFLITSILLLLGLSSFSKKECDIAFYYPGYEFVLNSVTKVKINKKITVNWGGDTTLTAVVFDCNGKSQFRFYKKGLLIIEENYESVSVTFDMIQGYDRKYKGYMDYPSGDYAILKKSGLCKYYDISGIMIKEELWKNDSLLSTKRY